MKEIEYDSKKWKDVTCSLIGRINIDKVAILPKAIYRYFLFLCVTSIGVTSAVSIELTLKKKQTTYL